MALVPSTPAVSAEIPWKLVAGGVFAAGAAYYLYTTLAGGAKQAPPVAFKGEDVDDEFLTVHAFAGDTTTPAAPAPPAEAPPTIHSEQLSTPNEEGGREVDPFATSHYSARMSPTRDLPYITPVGA